MIDVPALRDFMDGDPELLDATIESYASTFPEVLQQVEEAYQTKNLRQAEESLHALRGMVANFFAKDFIDALQAWETAAREGRLGFDSEDLALIRAWNQKLIPQLEQVLKDLQQAS